MTATARGFLTWIWVGVGLQIVGRILDGIWHANNDEFEAAAQQLEAHWLAWAGILVTLVAAALAVARMRADERNVSYAVILAGGALYIPVAIWHFIEHANYSDPELAHYLLVAGQLLILGGAIAAALLARRHRPLAA
jgi:isoprenylcysteine carboxyl methyltransferase (ICMT) family protein YpbQ